jgi:ATP-binding cassette, subfamily B, bacterial PglK
MIEIYRRILSLFDARERRRFWLLAVVMIGVAFAEVVGISSVLVLLNVLASPETIAENRVLATLYEQLGFSGIYPFQIFLAAGIFCVVLGTLVVKTLGAYSIIRFSNMRGYTLSSRLLAVYLNQPYAWFLTRNSAQIGKTVLNEVDQLVSRVIIPGLKLMSNVLVATSIIAFLVFVDPLVSLLATGLLGGGYSLIYLRLRGRLRELGEKMLTVNGERFHIAQEATGGIKDIKLMALESSYVRQFSDKAYQRARFTARIQIMSELPRFALEAITFGTLLGIVLILLLRSEGEIAGIIPTLGIFAFAVMRLLPALQQMYNSLANLRSGRAVLDHIVADFGKVGPGSSSKATEASTLKLEEALELDAVSFRYASADRPSLNDLSLTIRARTTVGLVGGTGAGKTTVVDLILGLLSPDAGELRVDGTPVTAANLRGWQKTLGYVPQAIYLTDDTVAANIAFGVPRKDIDMAAVERAARAAALHDFVTTEMSKGYDTMVGERGVRLSGGQRQRIGIARALYRNPSLLIMDEATSALDNITERAVMEAVQNIRADTTIILIAHRLSTVKDCDQIFLMEKGRVVAQGTYDDLINKNPNFRKMALGA